jgi:iron(III) transport system ATP-binding protein
MIGISGISKKFRSNDREVIAIENANLTIEDNEIVVLLGPSGSGKTTLLRCVAGLETANEGKISIGGQPVFDSGRALNIPAERRGLGMVFQSYAIWPHLTVAQNVALPLTHGRAAIPKAAVSARVADALQAVQLSGLENRPAPYLSGGQQQRVALARALAVEPQALLMDEPLSNLDARLREEVRVEIRDIVKKSGVPVLYVTHDQTEAMDLADRVAVMDKGRILQIDTPEAIYDRPANSTVASFLGSMNWIAGTVIDKSRIETPIGILAVSQAAAGPQVQLGIRPERIALSCSPASNGNSFCGQCAGISFLGDHRLYRVRIGPTTLVVKQAEKLAQDSLSNDVYLTLPADSILVFPA